MAYSGLADVALSRRQKSNDAARRALELDTSLAHSHALLGAVKMWYDWDFAGGEAEFKKALELDPNDATAHQWYAEIIGMMGAGSRKSLLKLIVLTSSIRYHRS